jgi:hypothetical protein
MKRNPETLDAKLIEDAMISFFKRLSKRLFYAAVESFLSKHFESQVIYWEFVDQKQMFYSQSLNSSTTFPLD